MDVYSSLKNLVSVFDESKPRVLVFSLPHGDVVNSVLEELGPMLKKGDVRITLSLPMRSVASLFPWLIANA
jgi:6-phosphogluconate dehydrogenase (decarboxylating)